MAVVTQVLEDGERNFVIKLNELAAAGANTISIASVAANTRFGAPARLRLDEVKYTTDQLITLSWDATADVDFLSLLPNQESFDFRDTGGINNNAGAGITGDVIVTPTATANYTMVLYFTKKFN